MKLFMEKHHQELEKMLLHIHWTLIVLVDIKSEVCYNNLVNYHRRVISLDRREHNLLKTEAFTSTLALIAHNTHSLNHSLNPSVRIMLLYPIWCLFLSLFFYVKGIVKWDFFLVKSLIINPRWTSKKSFWLGTFFGYVLPFLFLSADQ